MGCGAALDWIYERFGKEKVANVISLKKAGKRLRIESWWGERGRVAGKRGEGKVGACDVGTSGS
jgi:hypothetical protein